MHLEFKKEVTLYVVYKNWRGVTVGRIIKPKKLWFGSTKWHPKAQWLMDAWDEVKKATRTFAMSDFKEVRTIDLVGENNVRG